MRNNSHGHPSTVRILYVRELSISDLLSQQFNFAYAVFHQGDLLKTQLVTYRVHHLSSWMKFRHVGVHTVQMIITVASYKGGVAKSQSAVHLAYFLSAYASTLLLDGDDNRSVTRWAERGSLPFRVADERQAARLSRDYEHLVIDTQARPGNEDLKALADGCDLMIVPTPPDILSLDATILTVETLRNLKAKNYKVLLTMVAPRPSRDAEEARDMLEGAGVPVFQQVVHRLVAFSKAALAGTTVDKSGDVRGGTGWREYEAVGEQILKEVGHEQVRRSA